MYRLEVKRRKKKILFFFLKIKVFLFYLEEQIDHKQVFNEIGFMDRSFSASFIVNVVNRVDFEPRSV